MGAERRDSLVRVWFVLMGSLFGVSGCFQLNDPDWYFWIPLYWTSCMVNLAKPRSRSRKMAQFALWLGIILFIKVAVEDGGPGFWCVDMSERVVREKTGSGLVVVSMFLVLEARLTKYGMPILVGIGYGLTFLFFTIK